MKVHAALYENEWMQQKITTESGRRTVMTFEEEYMSFWTEFGKSKKMVLSTSYHDVVTSRTMSVVSLGGMLYFQTDKTFRKYEQLTNNHNVALCIDNLQIEGQCTEIGNPIDHEDFCIAYKAAFADSFHRYTMLKNERLFAVTPTFIERWIYLNGAPYMQIFDVKNKRYLLKQYSGE